MYDIILTENIDTLEPKNALAKEGINELKIVMNILGSKFAEIDLSTVRGLAYYTGTVFEVFDRAGKFRSILGGGRYDNMIELFGGIPAPATGFAIGYAPLQLLLKQKGLLPKPELGCDFFIVAVSENVVDEARNIASQLRTKFKVDMDLQGKKLSRQMSYADAIGAKKAVIIGEDEIKEGKLKVKDLDSGKEKKCTIDELMK